jgi:hypothetical protein
MLCVDVIVRVLEDVGVIERVLLRLDVGVRVLEDVGVIERVLLRLDVSVREADRVEGAVEEAVTVAGGDRDTVSDAVMLRVCVRLGDGNPGVCDTLGVTDDDAVAEDQLLTNGGMATPRKSVPYGALANGSMEPVAVTTRYSVVGLQVYSTKPSASARPASE